MDATIHRVPTWKGMAEAMSNETYDVVLLDLGLPDSSTDTTLSKIRELKMAHPSTAICVITGHPKQGEINAREAGADDFMHKTEVFGTSNLIRKVSELFSKFSNSGPMKKLDAQVKLAQQATQAAIEEFNKDADGTR